MNGVQKDDEIITSTHMFFVYFFIKKNAKSYVLFPLQGHIPATIPPAEDLVHNDARGDTVGRLSDRWRLAMGRSADLPSPQGEKTILFSVLGDVAWAAWDCKLSELWSIDVNWGLQFPPLWLIADSGSSLSGNG